MSAEINKTLGVPSNLDKKSAEFLSNALAKNTQQGFDYIKFRQSLNQIKKLNLDESTSIKSAFATASTIGLTKNSLINSGKHYLSVLMNEKSQFDQALNNQISQRVAARKNEVLQLEQKITEYRTKVKEIEKKIEEYKYRIDNSDSEVEKARKKIEDTKSKFELAFNKYVEIIESDISQFDAYLT